MFILAERKGRVRPARPSRIDQYSAELSGPILGHRELCATLEEPTYAMERAATHWCRRNPGNAVFSSSDTSAPDLRVARSRVIAWHGQS